MKARETKTCCTSNVCCLRAQIGGVRKYIYAVKNHVPLGALYKFFEVNHPSTTGSRIVSVKKTNVKFGIVFDCFNGLHPAPPSSPGCWKAFADEVQEETNIYKRLFRSTRFGWMAQRSEESRLAA